MDKAIKKRESYNTEIIKALSKAYELSEYFIRESIKGNKTSLTADRVKKDYNDLNSPTKNKLKEFQKNN